MKSNPILPGLVIIIVTSLAFLGIVAMMIAPRTDTASDEKLTVTFIPEKDGRVNVPHLILVKAESGIPGDSVLVSIHYYRDEEFHTIPLEPLRGTQYHGAEIPPAGLGQRTYYYIEASTISGGKIILPESASFVFTTGYDYYKVRWEGKASYLLLLLHIFLMIAAIFLLIHALYYALYFLQAGDKYKHLVKCVDWGTITFFITGFPIGWVIEKQVLGNYWEGIPFGWDITDSKTLFIFLYWIIFIILRRTGKIAERGFALSAVIGVIFTVIMFLIPHSF
ncbi:hypothetical protein ISS30_09050 [bacterium]|nr:hypothetical protein [bacterium]